jgi:ABC-type oligopeptide transport system ATPase subunit
MTPLIEVRGLRKVYTRTHWWQKRPPFLALDNVDLAIQSGQTMALVGESGSGKTTLAMCLVGLEPPDAGEIWFEGKNFWRLEPTRRPKLDQKSNLYSRIPQAR